MHTLSVSHIHLNFSSNGIAICELILLINEDFISSVETWNVGEPCILIEYSRST